jgi:hypothetical protein
MHEALGLIPAPKKEKTKKTDSPFQKKKMSILNIQISKEKTKLKLLIIS